MDFEGEAVGFVTSSARHSRQISELLFGRPRDSEDTHNDCVRVEAAFGALVPNAIRLKPEGRTTPR